MHRTQVYITEDQRTLIAERAEDAGVSQAEVVRRLLDEGLGIDGGSELRRSAIKATAGIARDEPDWPQWLGEVRGAPAAQRLAGLGQ